jgi:hypothetical protein
MIPFRPDFSHVGAKIEREIEAAPTGAAFFSWRTIRNATAARVQKARAAFFLNPSRTLIVAEGCWGVTLTSFVSPR